MNQMTKDEAAEFSRTERWRALFIPCRGAFQLSQAEPCMPEWAFAQGLAHMLGRPVAVIEDRAALRAEKPVEYAAALQEAHVVLARCRALAQQEAPELVPVD